MSQRGDVDPELERAYNAALHAVRTAPRDTYRRAYTDYLAVLMPFVDEDFWRELSRLSFRQWVRAVRQIRAERERVTRPHPTRPTWWEIHARVRGGKVRFRLHQIQHREIWEGGTPTRSLRRLNGSSGRPRAQATRSSARSGDSGEDDEESPSPASALSGRRR